MLKCPNKDVEIPVQVEKEHQINECQSFSPVDGVIGRKQIIPCKSNRSIFTLFGQLLILMIFVVHQNAGISKEEKLKLFSLPTAVTPVYSTLQLSPLAGPSNNSGYIQLSLKQ